MKEYSWIEFFKVLVKSSEVRHDGHVTESERYSGEDVGDGGVDLLVEAGVISHHLKTTLADDLWNVLSVNKTKQQ